MGEQPLSQPVKIVNTLGLHARASGKLVQLADQFNATIYIEKNSQVACADSVMELMMLMASLGDTVTVKATGPEASSALAAIVNLINRGFSEEIKEK